MQKCIHALLVDDAVKRQKIRLLHSKFYFIHESVPHTKFLNFQKIHISAQKTMEQKADPDATDGDCSKISIPALLEEKCTAIVIPDVPTKSDLNKSDDKKTITKKEFKDKMLKKVRSIVMADTIWEQVYNELLVKIAWIYCFVLCVQALLSLFICETDDADDEGSWQECSYDKLQSCTIEILAIIFSLFTCMFCSPALRKYLKLEPTGCIDYYFRKLLWLYEFTGKTLLMIAMVFDLAVILYGLLVILFVFLLGIFLDLSAYWQ